MRLREAGARIGDPWEAGADRQGEGAATRGARQAAQRQVLFTYLHLAPDPEQTEDLLRSGAICIATKRSPAARRAAAARRCRRSPAACRSRSARAAWRRSAAAWGFCWAAFPACRRRRSRCSAQASPARTRSASRSAPGARVYALDRSWRFSGISKGDFGARVVTVHSSRDTVESHVGRPRDRRGARSRRGRAEARQPAMVKEMKQGAVVVDIAIDQGGCFETSRPTTHADPTYVVDGVVHYAWRTCRARCRAPRPTRSTTPRCRSSRSCRQGLERALADDPHLRNGLNVARGKVTHHEVAAAVKASYFLQKSSSADARPRRRHRRRLRRAAPAEARPRAPCSSTGAGRPRNVVRQCGPRAARGRVSLRLPARLRRAPALQLQPHDRRSLPSSAIPRIAPFLWLYWKHSRPARHRAIAHLYAKLIEHCLAEHEALAAEAGATGSSGARDG